MTRPHSVPSIAPTMAAPCTLLDDPVNESEGELGVVRFEVDAPAGDDVETGAPGTTGTSLLLVLVLAIMLDRSVTDGGTVAVGRFCVGSGFDEVRAG